MDPQVLTEQLLSNDDYSLQLCAHPTSLILKLFIKVSEHKTDLYQITLNSLEDVDQLKNFFENFEEFKQYIKDSNHLFVDLEKKIIRVQISTKATFVSLPLEFLITMESRQKDDFPWIILEKCSSNKQISNVEIKILLEKITMQLLEQKKQNRLAKQQQQQSIRNLTKKLEADQAKYQEHKIKDEGWLTKMKNLISEVKQKELNKQLLKMEEYHKQNYEEKQNKILIQLNNLIEQKSKKISIELIEKINCPQIEQEMKLVKDKLERDISALCQRLGKIEISVEKMKEFKNQNETKMSQKIQSVQEKKEKTENFDVIKWVDPKGYSFENLILSGSTITAKSNAYVFGSNPIMGQYTFTAKFSQIHGTVQLGIIDKNGVQKQNYIWYQNDSKCYIGSSGIQKGSGFEIGEEVTVVIDIGRGSIQWQVDSQIRHEETLQILQDLNITWVPYIYFNNKNDSVEISEK